MTYKKIIEKYFDSWVKQDPSFLYECFLEDAVYIESYGPIYTSKAQIISWFLDYQMQGKVLSWDIKNLYKNKNTIIVEWYFKYKYLDEQDDFDGVSIFEFNADKKIKCIREFASSTKHNHPYQN